MIFISESITTKYLISPEKVKVSDFINKKIFNVADTPLTYRQINSMDTDNLLSQDRHNEKGWRKFSFKELTYLYIVSELKKFGFKHEQLNQLWEAFFKKYKSSEDKRTGDIQINEGIGEMIFGCVFGRIEIILCIDSTGRIAFYDPPFYSALYQSSIPQIQININSVVNNLLTKFGYTQIPVASSVQDAVSNWNKVDLTTLEEKMLEIIRNDDFTTIEVRKRDGKVSLLRTGKTNNATNDITIKEVMKIVGTKDFQDISISKRDGKIVNYKVEETIKL